MYSKLALRNSLGVSFFGSFEIKIEKSYRPQVLTELTYDMMHGLWLWFMFVESMSKNGRHHTF